MTLLTANSPPPCLIAVVGDVHGQWSQADGEALKALGVDLVLFVGDFGNEDIAIVGQVAALALPKAVVLGNHDAWYSASSQHRKRCPYDRDKEDRVQQQLDALGSSYVGYSKLEVPHHGFTVVGGRPYSWGGPRWRHRRFYRQRCGVASFDESAAKIGANIDAAAADTVIFLGHSGPQGLGDRTYDICGRDWKASGGDYGDPDLAQAIAYAKAQGRRVPLVTFGHMHHALKDDSTRLRTRLVIDPQGTVYLNAAQVPRVRGDAHSFTLVTLQAGQVQQVRLVWTTQQGKILSSEELCTAAADAAPD